MARSTRQERRQRRAKAAGTPPLRPTPRARPTTEEEPPPPQPAAEAKPERKDEVRSGVPGIRFLRESWAELNKVEWPNQQQLISGTAVVLVACLITGVYLYANDRLWEYVVKHVLLR
ncbi:MAG TPA: preprotein translocase subunit SecE [Gaiellaceae bacterium]